MSLISTKIDLESILRIPKNNKIFIKYEYKDYFKIKLKKINKREI